MKLMDALGEGVCEGAGGSLARGPFDMRHDLQAEARQAHLLARRAQHAELAEPEVGQDLRAGARAAPFGQRAAARPSGACGCSRMRASIASASCGSPSRTRAPRPSSAMAFSTSPTAGPKSGRRQCTASASGFRACTRTSVGTSRIGVAAQQGEMQRTAQAVAIGVQRERPVRCRSARRPYRSGERSRAARGVRTGRRAGRDPQSRRHDGAAAGAGGVRARARPEDRFDRGPDPLSPRHRAHRSSASTCARSTPSTARSACTPIATASAARCISRCCAAKPTRRRRRWCACTCRTRWPMRCIGAAPISARRSATCWRRSPREGRGALVLLGEAQDADALLARIREQPSTARRAGRAAARWPNGAATAPARRSSPTWAWASCACSARRASRSAWPASAWKSSNTSNCPHA